MIQPDSDPTRKFLWPLKKIPCHCCQTDTGSESWKILNFFWIFVGTLIISKDPIRICMVPVPNNRITDPDPRGQFNYGSSESKSTTLTQSKTFSYGTGVSRVLRTGTIPCRWITTFYGTVLSDALSSTLGLKRITLMRIQKMMLICHHWSTRLHFEPLKLLNFDFNEDPDPASKSNADSCVSWFVYATLF